MRLMVTGRFKGVYSLSSFSQSTRNESGVSFGSNSGACPLLMGPAPGRKTNFRD